MLLTIWRSGSLGAKSGWDRKATSECGKGKQAFSTGSRCERLRQLEERAELALWKRVVQE
jgi:hypothetical protein